MHVNDRENERWMVRCSGEAALANKMGVTLLLVIESLEMLLDLEPHDRGGLVGQEVN